MSSETTRGTGLTPGAEVRLGLVLFGGISLAVYINGVAQEFFRAVRGRGFYALLKRLVDADIVVDVISGTSAGGINGLLLAWAVANEREFEATRDIWLTEADAARLVHGPLDGPEPSLLDSRGYFLPQLVKAFDRMGPIDHRATAEAASRISELDLFTAATDFVGDEYREFDSTGLPVNVVNHRAVFRLKFRAGRDGVRDLQEWDDAGGTTSRADPPRIIAARRLALARLALCSSAVPAAFEPITVDAAVDDGNHQEEADWWLRRWGQFRERKYFIDGGVLQNKPFTPTLEAIFGRTADREVERYVCYVDPAPFPFPEADSGRPPDALATGWRSLTVLPLYESLAADLEAIKAHNDAVERYEALSARMATRAGGPRGVHRSTGPWSPDDDTYRIARLMTVTDRVVGAILNRADEHGWPEAVTTPGSRADGGLPTVADRRTAAQALARAFQSWVTTITASAAEQPLAEFDMAFRRRRLTNAIYEAYRLAFGRDLPAAQALAFAAKEQLHVASTASERREHYAPLLERLNESFQALEIVEHAMTCALEDTDFDWAVRPASDLVIRVADVWTRATSVLRTLLAVERRARDSARPGHYTPGDLARFNGIMLERARERRRRVAGQPPSTAATSETLARLAASLEWLDAHVAQLEAQKIPSDGCSGNVLALIDAHTEEAIEKLPAQDPVRVHYEHFDRLDEELLPMELASGLHERDVIRTVRFTPEERTGFCNRQPKLLGDKLFWFAAFLDRSWRRNDMMWGRLDAATRLITLLFSAQAEGRRESRATGITVTREDVEAAFPNGDAGRILRSVTRLAEDGWTSHDDPAVRDLVDAVQREILFEELKDQGFGLKLSSMTPAEFQAAYTTPDDTLAHLVRPGTVPLALKASVATLEVAASVLINRATGWIRGIGRRLADGTTARDRGAL